jgi:hypothetical protein
VSNRLASLDLVIGHPTAAAAAKLYNELDLQRAHPGLGACCT